MSGETARSVSGWTTDTLRYYLDEKIDGLHDQLDIRAATQQKALELAFSAQEKLLDTAWAARDRAELAAAAAATDARHKKEQADEKRFDSVNAFRAQLSEQAATFLRRTEAEIRMNSLSEKIDVLRMTADDRIRQLESFRSRATGVGAVMGLLAGVIAAAVLRALGG